MVEERKLSGLAGMVDDPDVLIRVAETVRDAGYRRWDCHTPYPVHGLQRAMGLGESAIPYFTILAGFCGAALAKTMQWWMSDHDFPLMIGGKPLFSLPAFVPVTFELFVLFAAVTTFVAILLFCKLGRWHSPLYAAGLMERVTSDRFCVVLDAEDERFSEEAGRRLLESGGCEEIHLLYEEEE